MAQQQFSRFFCQCGHNDAWKPDLFQYQIICQSCGRRYNVDLINSKINLYSTPAYPPRQFCLFCSAPIVQQCLIYSSFCDACWQVISNYNWYTDENEEEKGDTVKADLIWDDKVGAYRLTMHSQHRGEFGIIKDIVDIIKGTIPSHERDYDPTTKNWFLHEKWLPVLKPIIAHKISESNLFFFEKPDNTAVNFAQSYPIDADLEKFREMLVTAKIENGSSQTLVTLDILKKWSKEEAIKAYRKAALFYHPDRNPQNGALMSSLNEVWNRLKEGFYIK